MRVYLLATLLASAFASASPAFAAAKKTVLHVPLFVEVTKGNPNSPDYDYIPVAVFNKTLVAKGQPAQLEFVDLDIDTKFDSMDARDKLDAAIQAAGIENTQAFGEYYPANWGDQENYTCYRGNPNGVLDIVLANTDNMYSDQYTFIAMKIGKKTVIGEGVSDDEETRRLLNDESPLWKNYDAKSDSVLILASIGDDGTDVQESLIRRCK
jgi:hypothetical protein